MAARASTADPPASVQYQLADMQRRLRAVATALDAHSRVGAQFTALDSVTIEPLRQHDDGSVFTPVYSFALLRLILHDSDQNKPSE